MTTELGFEFISEIKRSTARASHNELAFSATFLHGKCFFERGKVWRYWKALRITKNGHLSEKADKLTLNFLAMCLLHFGSESKWFWLAWDSLHCASRLFSKLIETACWWCWADWTHHLLHAAQAWNFSQHFDLNNFYRSIINVKPVRATKIPSRVSRPSCVRL